MTDWLKYRLPNGEVVTKIGAFLEQQFEHVREGFIVTNFDKSRTFIFRENSWSTFYQEEETPICYSKEEYLEKAGRFVDEIRSRNLSKAIFSRIKSFPSKKGLVDIFDELEEKYPSAFVYLISSEQFGTWVGATPEILLSSNQRTGKTVALAGTKKADDASDWGEKEQFEQQYVTDFIEDQLNSLSLKSISKDGPNERIAGPVKHLETKFEFSMSGIRPIEIAGKLHPTPAVSGLPQAEAIHLINEMEDHDRNLYTGCIGLVGAKTQLYVNLRCAQFMNNHFYLYLGGGFTKDSDPLKEWEETENKSRTLLDILEESN